MQGTGSTIDPSGGTGTGATTGEPTTSGPGSGGGSTTSGDPTLPEPTTSGDPTLPETSGESTTGASDADFEQLGDAEYWSRRIGNDGDQTVSALAPAKGSGFIVGGFSGYTEVNFGEGVVSVGSDFVARFGGDGSAQWVKDIDGVGVADVAVGPAGEVFVAMELFFGTDLGGGIIEAGDSPDVLVARYAPDGAFVWARGYGDDELQEVSAIAVNGKGEIAVAGFFRGAIDFGGGPLVAKATSDGFVAHLDGDGKHLWSRSFGDAQGGYNDVSDVGFDAAGNLVLVGSQIGVMDFGDGPVPDVGGNNAFVARYGADHSLQWKKIYDAGISDDSARVVVVGDNAVYVSGILAQGSIDFGGGPLDGTNFTNIFVVKLDAAGKHGWSKLFGAPECMQDVFCERAPTALAHAPGMGVVVSGWFGDSIELGGGLLTTPTGDLQGFAAMYTEAGAHVWSRTIGPETADTPDVASIADADGAWIFGTQFAGEIDVGHGIHTSAGSTDMLLARAPWAGG